jgi:hypothetical protein
MVIIAPASVYILMVPMTYGNLRRDYNRRSFSSLMAQKNVFKIQKY